MNTLISILVGAVIFYLVVWVLIPMLPAAIGTFVLVIVILIAIIWLLSLLTGGTWPNWPWKK
jgi:hypothetical protein